MLDAPFKIAADCCSVMKKAPTKQYERHEKMWQMTAMMTEESRLRKTSWLKYGCNGFDMKRPRSMPMAFWTEQDVLHYLKKYDVPYCSVYGEIRAKRGAHDFDGQISMIDEIGYEDGDTLETTGCDRTGCIFCGFGCHLEKGETKFQRLKKTHRRQWEYCMGGGEWVDGLWQPNKEGLGMAYVLDYIEVKYE